ncbi:hypothetical protein F5888DRAFT_871346 [Russula emetica]|nr:hypothetical protein F5888DRAFT_871346 [Russula emetica]
MSRTTLRPCLKHHTDPDPPAPPNTPFPFALSSSVLGPRVHFPPAPGLCQTHLTHSASNYDRAPIVVLPNDCALPARNERTYTPSNECSKKWRSAQAATAHGAALHPHAFATESAKVQAPAGIISAVPVSPVDPVGRVPPLVADLSSSESDESDVSSTPLVPNRFPSTGHPPISIVDGNGDASATALSFLPHANEREKPRKERNSRSRSHGSPRSVRKSEFAVAELDGCLGGF